MKKVLATLINKQFSVYVCGEFESRTSFLGFMNILAKHSDFFHYTSKEQTAYLQTAVKDHFAPVCDNIYVKII